MSKVMNQYTNMAEYYDLVMTNGYYDYEKRAKAIAAVLPENPNVIEIGVGTGLVLEQLLKLDPEYNLTGIDHTPAMLEIAKRRLGDGAKLIEGDIVSVSSPEQFDVAFSNGGIGAFVHTGSDYEFYTHIPDYEDNVEALKNIATCLKSGGLFLINVRGKHPNYDQVLPGGIVYTQGVVESTKYEGCVEKTFYFKKGDEILAQQLNIYRVFRGSEVDDIFSRANFNLVGVDESGLLRIYAKA